MCLNYSTVWEDVFPCAIGFPFFFSTFFFFFPITNHHQCPDSYYVPILCEGTVSTPLPVSQCRAWQATWLRGGGLPQNLRNTFGL